VAPDGQRHADARAFVRHELSVSTMAERLGDLYAELIDSELIDAGPFEPEYQLVGTRR